MSSNNPILILTWGDPSQWDTAKYYCKNNNEKSNFTDLVCYNNISKVILIVLDSIITPNLKKPDTKDNKSSDISKYERTIKCMEESEITLAADNGISINVNTNNYEEWLDKVKKYTKCVLKESLSLQNDINTTEFLDNKTDIIIIPAIGRYNNYEYNIYEYENKNKRENFYLPADVIKSILYMNLYKELKDVESNEIILDLTHGLNYVAALALVVMQKLSSIINKNLRINNAIPTAIINKNLRINNAIPTKPPKEYLLIEVAKFTNNELDFEDINQPDKQFESLINSLKYNGVLLLSYIYELYKENYEKFGENYENYIKNFNSSMEIKIIDNVTKIGVKDIRVFGNLKEDKILSWIIFDTVFRKLKSLKLEDPFTIEALRTIANKIFYSEASKSIISTELNNIFNILKDSIENRKNDLINKIKENNNKILLKDINNDYFTSYGENIEFLSERNKEISNNSNYDSKIKRNFIAHAGLLKDLVILDFSNIDLSKIDSESIDSSINKIRLYYNLNEENIKLLEFAIKGSSSVLSKFKNKI